DKRSGSSRDGPLRASIRRLGPLDQAHHQQEDYCANRRIDDLGDEPAADEKSDTRQQPPGDDRSDNAHNDVADQPEAPALHDLSGEPTGNRTNDEPNDDDDWIHAF